MKLRTGNCEVFQILSLVLILVFATHGSAAGIDGIDQESIDEFLASIDEYLGMSEEELEFQMGDYLESVSQLDRLLSEFLRLNITDPSNTPEVRIMLNEASTRLRELMADLRNRAQKLEETRKRNRTFSEYAASIAMSTIKSIWKPAPPPNLVFCGPQDADGPSIVVEQFEIVDQGSNSSSQYEVSLLLRNAGTASYVGPCIFSAGLAYTQSWIPETPTVFDSHVRQIELSPGAEVSLAFQITEVPTLLYLMFRLHLAVTWTGYEDIDPVDYIGFVMNLDIDGFPMLIGYEEIQ
ncbi:hypothetical protein ACFLSW_01080 [Candidatus Bipolaricaulota bacterium]